MHECCRSNDSPSKSKSKKLISSGHRPITADVKNIYEKALGGLSICIGQVSKKGR